MHWPKLSIGPAVQYCKLAFSDNGSPSSSRLMTLLTVLVSCGTLIYSVVKTGGHFPDGMTLTGLGTFAVSPYAINRATTAWGKDQGPKPDVTLPGAPQV